MGVLRLLAMAALVAVYALASHEVMTRPGLRPLAGPVIFGPMLLAGVGVAWQRHQRWPWWVLITALALLSWVLMQGSATDLNLLYVAQHAAIHLSLATLFLLTLRTGCTPLITALADRVHQQTTPAMKHYTHRLTRAWALYFVGMVFLSLVIYGLAPWSWWSVFGNLLTPLSAAAFFVIEHRLRYHWHPEFERVTLRAMMQAWQERGRQRGQRAEETA